MQLSESEIVILLNNKPYLKDKSFFVSIYIPPVLGCCFFIFWMILGFKLADDANKFPQRQAFFHQGMMIGIVVFTVFLAAYGFFSLSLIRQIRAPLPYVRISHEGIFTSQDSFLVRWAEIRELSSSTFKGMPYLGIVPWNLEELVARVRRSVPSRFRLGNNILLMFFRHSNSSVPIGFAQVALPIPINDLLTVIQEQFGAELQENHIFIVVGKN